MSRSSALSALDREPASLASLTKAPGGTPARPGEGSELSSASISSSGHVGHSRKPSASKRPVDTIKTVVQRVEFGGERGSMDVLRHEWKRKRTKYLRWEFERHGRTHSIALEHGLVWGRRRILVDEEEVLNERILFDAGSSYTFEFGGIQLKLLLIASSRGFAYELLFNQCKPLDVEQEDGETTFTFENPEGFGCPDSP